jgi:ATP-dependent Clp protease ATP-binding subunit ClpC
MTSNLGTEYVHKSGSLGFLQNSASHEERQSHEKIEKALKGTFRPEFLNRIDEVIIFSPLSEEQVEQIVTLQMKEIEERLSEHGVSVTLTKEAARWLVHEGYNPAFGARPMRRALQKFVESPLSIQLLGSKLKTGTKITVDVEESGDKLVFKFEE